MDTSRRVKKSQDTFHGQSFYGGMRPYGYIVAQNTEKYHRTLIIDDDEADILRVAADDILHSEFATRHSPEP